MIAGLITRNMLGDLGDNVQRNKVCDAIAVASIVANCAGVETSKGVAMSVQDFHKFLVEFQKETLSEKDILWLIHVSSSGRRNVKE